MRTHAVQQRLSLILLCISFTYIMHCCITDSHIDLAELILFIQRALSCLKLKIHCHFSHHFSNKINDEKTDGEKMTNPPKYTIIFFVIFLNEVFSTSSRGM